jgi:hypothetical protein
MVIYINIKYVVEKEPTVNSQSESAGERQKKIKDGGWKIHID